MMAELEAQRERKAQNENKMQRTICYSTYSTESKGKQTSQWPLKEGTDFETC